MIAAAASGALVGAPAAGAAAAPAVAAATALEATEAVVKAVKAFITKQEADNYLLLFTNLKHEYPQYDDDTLRRLIAKELDYEREFSRKMIDRVRADMAAAMKLDDPDARRMAVTAMLEREKRYLAMRQEAMIQRAHGAIEVMRLKVESPQGAFWMLSDRVKNHTLDCIALSGQFWPWEVLDALHPPIHVGCACYLIPLHEAITSGYMRLSMIPDTQDAIRRARQIMRDARRMEEAASPEQIAEHLSLLEAGQVDPGFIRRFPKGTREGGRFMPRRGALSHPIERKLRDLLPGRLSPVDRLALGTGRWRWAGRRKVFIPEQRTFSRHLDGHHFTSPVGSTNLYRDGKFVVADRRDPGTPAPLFKPPTMEGEHLAALASRPPDITPSALGDHTPATYEEYARETGALAFSLGARYDAPVKFKGVEYDKKLSDHAGLTTWDGTVKLGAYTKGSLLDDQKFDHPQPWYHLRSLFGTYKVQAHEASHTVNPAPPDDYVTPTGRVLEEALAEEASHVVAVEQLRRHGRQDVLEWVKQNPLDDKVQGSYIGYRAALADTLDEVGLHPDEYEGAILNLKFRVPPSLRMDVLAAYAHEHGVEIDKVKLADDMMAAVDRHQSDTQITPLIPWHLDDVPDANSIVKVKDHKLGMGAEVSYLAPHGTHTSTLASFVRAPGDDWAAQTVEGDWVGPSNFREVVSDAPDSALEAQQRVRDARSIHGELASAIKNIRFDTPSDPGTDRYPPNELGALHVTYDNFSTDTSEVANALGVTQAQALKMLRGLEAKGLVVGMEMDADSGAIRDTHPGSYGGQDIRARDRGAYTNKTWQSNMTYDSHSWDEVAAEARANGVSEVDIKQGKTPGQIKAEAKAKKLVEPLSDRQITVLANAHRSNFNVLNYLDMDPDALEREVQNAKAMAGTGRTFGEQSDTRSRAINLATIQRMQNDPEALPKFLDLVYTNRYKKLSPDLNFKDKATLARELGVPEKGAKKKDLVTALIERQIGTREEFIARYRRDPGVPEKPERPQDAREGYKVIEQSRVMPVNTLEQVAERLAQAHADGRRDIRIRARDSLTRDRDLTAAEQHFIVQHAAEIATRADPGDLSKSEQQLLDRLRTSTDPVYLPVYADGSPKRGVANRNTVSAMAKLEAKGLARRERREVQVPGNPQPSVMWVAHATEREDPGTPWGGRGNYGEFREKLKADRSIDGYRTEDGYTITREYAPATGNEGKLQRQGKPGGALGTTVYAWHINAPDGTRLSGTTVLRSAHTQSVIDAHRAAAAAKAAIPPEQEYVDLAATARAMYEEPGIPGSQRDSLRLLLTATDAAVRDIKAGRAPSDFTQGQIAKYRHLTEREDPGTWQPQVDKPAYWFNTFSNTSRPVTVRKVLKGKAVVETDDGSRYTVPLGYVSEKPVDLFGPNREDPGTGRIDDTKALSRYVGEDRDPELLRSLAQMIRDSGSTVQGVTYSGLRDAVPEAGQDVTIDHPLLSTTRSRTVASDFSKIRGNGEGVWHLSMPEPTPGIYVPDYTTGPGIARYEREVLLPGPVTVHVDRVEEVDGQKIAHATVLPNREDPGTLDRFEKRVHKLKVGETAQTGRGDADATVWRNAHGYQVHRRGEGNPEATYDNAADAVAHARRVVAEPKPITGDDLFRVTNAEHLPPEQEAAVLKYQRDPHKMDDADRAALLALVTAHPLPGPIKLNRKVALHELDGVKPGDVVTEDRFISTAAGYSGIGMWASDHGTLNLSLPAGTPAWANPWNYSEDEVILAPGLRYRVDKVDTSNGHPKVEATVLPPDREDPGTSHVLSSEDAKAWMAAAPKGAWTGIQYHGTNESGAASLAADGVLPARARLGGLFTTDKWADAELFSSLPRVGDGPGTVVPLAVRMDRPLVLRARTPVAGFTAFQFQYAGTNTSVYERAREAGFDGVVFPRKLGEQWVVVLNPDSARVVAPERGDPGTVEDYRINHRAPGPDETNARADNIEQVMPDFYSHPGWYKTGDDIPDGQSVSAVQRIRDKPDEKVWVYRAAPVGQLNSGDWVTLSRAYAEHHALHPTDPAQDMPVFARRVRAGDLWTDGNSINEFGYSGPSLSIAKVPGTGPKPSREDPGTGFSARMFHGSPAKNRKAIEHEGLRSVDGNESSIWLTSNHEDARSYAKHYHGEAKGVIVPVDVHLQQPFYRDQTTDETIWQAARAQGVDVKDGDPFWGDAIKAAGYDGIVYKRRDGATQAEVFDPAALQVDVPGFEQADLQPSTHDLGTDTPKRNGWRAFQERHHDDLLTLQTRNAMLKDRAAEVAKAVGGEAHVNSVVWGDPSKIDHNGEYKPDTGTIILGRNLPGSLTAITNAAAQNRPLTESEAKYGWLAFEVMQHEIGHSINPIPMDVFQKTGNRELEEGINEELARVQTVEWLKERGLTEPLSWLKTHPDDFQAQGTYQGFRKRIGEILTKAGVPRSEWQQALEHMKFDLTADERIDYLTRLLPGGKDVRPDPRWVELRDKIAALKPGEHQPQMDALDVERTDAGYTIKGALTPTGDLSVDQLKRAFEELRAGTYKGPTKRVTIKAPGTYATPDEAVTATLGDRVRYERASAEFEVRRMLANAPDALALKDFTPLLDVPLDDVPDPPTMTITDDTGVTYHLGDPVDFTDYDGKVKLAHVIAISPRDYGATAPVTVEVDGETEDGDHPGETKPRRTNASLDQLRQEGVQGRNATIHIGDHVALQHFRSATEAGDVSWVEGEHAVVVGILRHPVGGDRLTVRFSDGLEKENVIAKTVARLDVQEVVFEPNLHPRDRTGKWIRKGRFTPETAKAIFDGFKHGGLRAQVNFTHSEAPRVVAVSGTIHRGDKKVGEFARRFEDHKGGAHKVVHLTLKLNREEQGKGFGAALNKHAEDQYRKHGVDHIELTAADQVGGYAWARAGYQFIGPSSDTNERLGGAEKASELGRSNEELVDSLVEDGHITQKMADDFYSRFADSNEQIAYQRAVDPASIEKLIAQSGEMAKVLKTKPPTWPKADPNALDGKFSTPQEIAAFGHEHTWSDGDGHQMWFGKAFMLGSRWEGRKTLHRDQLTSVAENPLMDVPTDGLDPFVDLDPTLAAAIKWFEPPEIEKSPPFLRHVAEADVVRRMQDDPDARETLLEDYRTRWEQWKETTDTKPEKWTPPKGVTYSPAVKQINSPADAVAYFKTIGVDASGLIPPDTEQGRNIAKDTDFFRQIAQAVTDGQKRNPVLKKGPYPLGRIAFFSNTEGGKDRDHGIGKSQTGVWATTGIDIGLPNNVNMYSLPPDGSGPADPWTYAGHLTAIVISDINQGGVQDRSAPIANGDTAISDQTPYGRMTHEIGHAVYQAAGTDSWDSRHYEQDDAPWDMNLLTKADVGPQAVDSFSHYAATNPGEAWAEIYSILHVPGALKTVPTATRTKLRALKKIALTRDGKDKLL